MCLMTAVLLLRTSMFVTWPFPILGFTDMYIYIRKGFRGETKVIYPYQMRYEQGSQRRQLGN